jgi:hypothetical protein
MGAVRSILTYKAGWSNSPKLWSFTQLKLANRRKLKSLEKKQIAMLPKCMSTFIMKTLVFMLIIWVYNGPQSTGKDSL